MTRRQLREEYTVRWVCAPPNRAGRRAEDLDGEHEDLEQDENDIILFALGRIRGYNVVLACLPAGQTGTNSATAVATQLKATLLGPSFEAE
jgi:hypothetical protein